jgi:transcriptional regulator with XRE-family HTH domain
MKINTYSTSMETKSELARRFKAYRISLNLTQLDVANKSGVSLGAVKSFERTGSISLDSLIKLLKALSLLENIDALIPDLGIDAVALYDLGHQRQRARKKKKATTMPWGDEQ